MLVSALGHSGLETVVATRSGKHTHSEGQCREWSAVDYSGGPKAELARDPQQFLQKPYIP